VPHQGEFAIVDDLLSILSPRERLMKAFNPQILEQRAYSMKYQEKPRPSTSKRRAVIGPNNNELL
jgi:hypothetical protein